jgi:hypothetical protein
MFVCLFAKYGCKVLSFSVQLMDGSRFLSSSFGFVFGSNQYIWFGLWLDQRFPVNLFESTWSGQGLRPCLADNVFAKSYFSLRMCLANTPYAFYDSFGLKNEFLPNKV